ncbi:MAG: ribose 5-phosphate isomerase B [Candidatus Aenigmarchaeota archaeon]|nr:ribose 5-phosphate isomerase B [Candidatus Aenigmarchaeota archaeon]
MPVAIGSDHGGFELKEKIKKLLESEEVEFNDFGCFSEESCDHPLIAKDVAEAVSSGAFSRGILICGTGIGMSLAANKVKGIRAAVAYSVETAKLSREHNDSNILCLGGRTQDHKLALEMVKVWISTNQLPVERYTRRTRQIMELEK